MKKTTVLIFASLLSLIPSFAAQAQEEQTQSYQKTFVITAYYSPIEGQQRYIKGSLEADKRLNGNGTNGADGTPVFPGMIAAPKTYAFGTKMSIPGIGTVSVHDRGGAIVTGEGTSHGYDRLDIWMGKGDEGLNRALAWGKRTVTVTVYGINNSITETVDLSSLDKLTKNLASTKYENSNFSIFRQDFGLGDKSESIVTIKEKLAKLGYYNSEMNGDFDLATYLAVQEFQLDYGIVDSSNDFGAGYFGPQTRKTLEKVLSGELQKKQNIPLLPLALAQKVDKSVELQQLAGNGLSFLKADLKPGDSGQAVLELQTELKKLNYFGIDPTGKYGELTTHAIFKFQQSQGLITDISSPGAGMLGPQTRAALAAIISERIDYRQKVNKKSNNLVAKR